MIIFISVLIAVFATTGICSIVYFFSEIDDIQWWAVLLGIFLLVCAGGFFYWGMKVFKDESKKEAAKPVVISTTTPPQIDTTITYSKGVADTVYTYHIIKKK